MPSISCNKNLHLLSFFQGSQCDVVDEPPKRGGGLGKVSCRKQQVSPQPEESWELVHVSVQTARVLQRCYLVVSLGGKEVQLQQSSLCQSRWTFHSGTLWMLSHNLTEMNFVHVLSRLPLLLTSFREVDTSIYCTLFVPKKMQWCIFFFTEVLSDGKNISAWALKKICNTTFRGHVVSIIKCRLKPLTLDIY